MKRPTIAVPAWNWTSPSDQGRRDLAWGVAWTVLNLVVVIFILAVAAAQNG